MRQLVESETLAATASDTLASAEALMAGQPEALLHKLLRHVQTLFNVPDLKVRAWNSKTDRLDFCDNTDCKSFEKNDCSTWRTSSWGGYRGYRVYTRT